MEEPQFDEKKVAEKKLRAELGRLKTKRAGVRDKDLLSVLDLRINQIEAELPPAPTGPVKPEEPVIDETLPEKPTPQAAMEADNLIRQARVEKMRKNINGATDALRKAAEIAPGSPVVLEALGDDLVERKRMGEARVAYMKATRLDPKNVALEKKYALLVLQMEAAGSLDDQMRANLGGDLLLSSDDRMASLPVAIIMTLIFPGAGHLILGLNNIGFTLLGIWAGCSIWLLTMTKDLYRLIAFASGGHQMANLTVLAPLAILSALYIGALASLKGLAKPVLRVKVPHPVPPVNMAFEADLDKVVMPTPRDLPDPLGEDTP